MNPHDTTTAVYPLSYRRARTYRIAAVFIAGNLVLPQLCHLLPLGGPRLLPIYFLTIVAAWRYGWRVGVLCAVLSPTLNMVLFGMPSLEVWPVLVLKSLLAALFAGWVGSRSQPRILLALAGVVLAYQGLGSLAEWAIQGDFYIAMQDFRIGLPGMILQVFGAYLLLGYLTGKDRRKVR